MAVLYDATVHRLASLILLVALAANAQLIHGQTIRDAALLSPNDGWLLSDRLLMTNDAGATWRDVTPSARPDSVFFLDRQTGWSIAGDQVSLTADGGQTWTSASISFDLDRYSGNASLHFADRDRGWLLVQFVSSSNFSRGALFATIDGGRMWHQVPDPPAAGRIRFTSASEGTIIGGPSGTQIFATHDAGLTWQDAGAASEETRGRNILRSHNLRGTLTGESFAGTYGWMVVQQGVCTGFKTNCTQSSRLYRTSDGGVTIDDITSSRLALKPHDATLPEPSIVFTTHRGFDKCDAPTLAGLQDWWQNSPYKDLNIYIGGVNRGCKTQANMTPDWIKQVSAIGWSFIPTWVGPQAPCTSSTKSALISTNTTTAAQQGVTEADSAAAALDALGLPRTVVYYDMEFYSVPRGNTTCAPAVKAFLTSWMNELRAHGILAGAYGSPINMAADWTSIPLDAIWFARWDFRPSIWGDPTLSDQYWINHQRIHQYYNTDNSGGETWGSTQMYIDANVSDAPLATAMVDPNITPETGWWVNPKIQNGVAFFLEKQADGNILFAGLLYDTTGRPTWLVSSGKMSGSSYTGSLDTYSSGPTLTSDYKAAHLGGSVGNLNLQFFDSSHATMSWPGGVIPIQRFAFSTGFPAWPGDVHNGWWYEPDASGNGSAFAIEGQNSSVFVAALVYDDSGNPVWYISNGFWINSMYYLGNWAQYGNGQTLTGAIKSPSLVNPNVGPLSLIFANPTLGFLRFPNGRQIIIRPLQF